MTEAPETIDQGTRALADKFDAALQHLASVRPFARSARQPAVLDIAGRLLRAPGGIEALYRRAPGFDAAGLFWGSDWDEPGALLPSLVARTLDHGERATVVLEALSQLRLLAIANGQAVHAGVHADQARHQLTQILALNLQRLTAPADEAARRRLGELAAAIPQLMHFLLEHIGFDDILGSLVREIRRILAQRPIQIGHVRGMITQIAVSIATTQADIGDARLGADRLISALFGPTRGSEDDPGIHSYLQRLEAMDPPALQQEARGFARAMHDTGLVSDYHAAFLRWVVPRRDPLLADALGLSSTGLDALRCYRDLVDALVEAAVHPATAQSVYGLALMLERGVLYQPPIAPALWRQLRIAPSAATEALLRAQFGSELPARVHLLAGTMALLGQPLGVGQGNNPTCQAARALSMWSLNEPAYLLQLIAQVARSDAMVMHFEGRPIDSASTGPGGAVRAPLDTDPVSLLLVPHLDRVYHEMGRLCVGRPGDPHRWVNPEFHGWWVGREFDIAVDVASGRLHEHERFLRRFYASYHPYHNGNQPLIYPQPAGVAVTDSNARFVGWHAITLLRVALDQDGVMRAYFYNPNNDSGQDWGHGVVVSTEGHGERFGEASLPFAELASRLYIFHDDPADRALDPEIPADEIESVRTMAERSWAADRV